MTDLGGLGAVFSPSSVGEPVRPAGSAREPRVERRCPGRPGRERQSGWRDLNPRPLAPKASALPSCATPRGGMQSMPSTPTHTSPGPHPIACSAVGSTDGAHRPARGGRQQQPVRSHRTPREQHCPERTRTGSEARSRPQPWAGCAEIGGIGYAVGAPPHGGRRGRSSMVELQSSKLTVRVRFPSPAPPHSGPGQRHDRRTWAAVVQPSSRRRPGLTPASTSCLVVIFYPVRQPHELIPEFSGSTNLDVVNTATPTLQPDVSGRPDLGYAGRLTQPERHARQRIKRGQQFVRTCTPCLLADSAQVPASLEGSAHLDNGR